MSNNIPGNSFSDPNPILNIQENPEINVQSQEEKIDEKGEFKLVKDQAKKIGKMNILEWINSEMSHERNNQLITDVKAQKALDNDGNCQWQLVDVKHPNKDKDKEPTVTTHLQIQIFWVITTKDEEGNKKETIVTQFLMTEAPWPKENSALQLDAVRRATIGIDLYTQTMMRPLNRPESELPIGFRFQDLIGFRTLHVGIESRGSAKDEMRVRVATPEGQGGGNAWSLDYSLTTQKVTRKGVPLLNINRIEQESRSAVVKQANGREINSSNREAYLAQLRLDELYKEAIKEEQNIDFERMNEVVDDPKKLDHLLTFMDKDRERHVIQFESVNASVFSGPKVPPSWLKPSTWHTKLWNGIKHLYVFQVDSTVQQRLQNFLDRRDQYDALNVQIEKQRATVEQLHIEKNTNPAFTEKYQEADRELSELVKIGNEQRLVLEGDRNQLISALHQMEVSHRFLTSKKDQYGQMALFLAAKAAGKEDPHDVSQFAIEDLDKMFIEGQKNLTPTEHQFIVNVRAMGLDIDRMEGSMKELRDKLGIKEDEKKKDDEFDEFKEFDININEVDDEKKDIDEFEKSDDDI